MSRSAHLYCHVAQNNPIRPKIAHLWDTRDKNTLWWYASVKPLLQYKRVVRSWSARRVRIAFVQALKARGFDREGRAMDRLDEAADEHALIQPASLTGTAEIAILPSSIKADSATLQRDVDIMLDYILEKQRKSEGAG